MYPKLLKCYGANACHSSIDHEIFCTFLAETLTNTIGLEVLNHLIQSLAMLLVLSDQAFQ